MSIRVADISLLQAVKTSAFSPDVVRTAYVTSIGDFFKYTAGVTLTPVSNVVVNSADGLGQWTRMGVMANRRLLIWDAAPTPGLTLNTSPFWAAGTFRRLELTLTVSTPPGSGSMFLLLTGRGGTYNSVNMFGLGGAAAGSSTAAWTVFNAGTATVFAKFTIDIVTGRPLGLIGQVTDTTNGYVAAVSGYNATTTGNATNLVISTNSAWSGSIYLEGIL